MRCDFRPRLVNGPFEDPVLLVSFGYQRRALLFDLGDIQGLGPRDLLKVSHVFVTHTHMDHFCGFDRLLRVCLGRAKDLRLYGPRGFIDNIAGKLTGYCWDLVDNYDQSLRLWAVEVSPAGCLTQLFECQKGFVPQRPPHRTPFEGLLLQEPAFAVHAAVLAHSSPCLGFSLTERFHVNILSTGIAALGLTVGPWIGEFKAALYARAPADTPVTAMTCDGKRRCFALATLTAALARITPGQKIAYVTDAADTPANAAAIVALARRANRLYIETPFLDHDRVIARRRHHLTAARAGTIAGRAGVDQLHPMHFSPRYSDSGDRLVREARQTMAQTPEDPV